ncbi:hypothetical protein HZS_6354, partial [Henneguya salminicola]
MPVDAFIEWLLLDHKMNLILLILFCYSLINVGLFQDYQLMYEPLYPSGSSRMQIGENSNSAPKINIENPNPKNSLNAVLTVSQMNYDPSEEISEENSTYINDKDLPGLNGIPCKDTYNECPEFKENKYCSKYRKQMLFQCRKTCGFCCKFQYYFKILAIDPFEDVEGSGIDEDEESSGEEDNSGLDMESNNSDVEKRSTIIKNGESIMENNEEMIVEDEKHFNLLKSRFKMPGLVPSLEDLYAELGTLHPTLDKRIEESKIKTEASKRSKIYKKKDPFKYLRNKIDGSSMRPIVDISSLSSGRVQRSNPVYVVKNPRAVISSKFRRSIADVKSSNTPTTNFFIKNQGFQSEMNEFEHIGDCPETQVDSKSWIGLYQTSNNRWKWTSNEKSSYRNWNNIPRTSEKSQTSDCVYVSLNSFDKTFTWYDHDCNKNLQFLCFSKCPEVINQWPGWINLTNVNNRNDLYGFLFESFENWVDAEEKCRQFDSHLASFDSLESYLNIIKMFNTKSDKIWIGLNDRDNEGNWKWIDNSQLTFTHWSKNYPNNNNQNCTYFDPKDSTWDQCECNQKLISVLTPIYRWYLLHQAVPAHLEYNLHGNISTHAKMVEFDETRHGYVDIKIPLDSSSSEFSIGFKICIVLNQSYIEKPFSLIVFKFGSHILNVILTQKLHLIFLYGQKSLVYYKKDWVTNSAYNKFFIIFCQDEIQAYKNGIMMNFIKNDFLYFVDRDIPDAVIRTGFELETSQSSIHLFIPDGLKTDTGYETEFSISFKLKIFKNDPETSFQQRAGIFNILSSNQFVKDSMFWGEVLESHIIFHFIIYQKDKFLIWNLTNSDPISYNSWDSYVMTFRFDLGLSLYVNGFKKSQPQYPYFDILREIMNLNSFIVIGSISFEFASVKNKIVEIVFKSARFDKYELEVFYMTPNHPVKITDAAIYIYKIPRSLCDGVLRLIWSDIYTHDLDTILHLKSFPNNPTSMEVSNNFSLFSEKSLNNGLLIQGYYYHPVTGNFTFVLMSIGLFEIWIDINNSKILNFTHNNQNDTDDNLLFTYKSENIKLYQDQKIVIKIIYKSSSQNFLDFKVKSVDFQKFETDQLISFK